MTAIRSNLTFSVCNYARYMSNSSAKHFKALNRVWQYIRTIKNKDLRFYEKSNKSKLIDYVDSDWRNHYDTRISITDYIFLFLRTSISWSSKLQKASALSSYETEYMRLRDDAKEIIWLQSIFKEVRLLNEYRAKTIYCDNMSALALSKNSKHHARTKHIDVHYHYIRYLVERQ